MDVNSFHRRIFADKLATAMLAREVTQEALSEATGISQSTMSRLINAGTDPSLANLVAFCVFFEVQPAYFLDPSIEPLPLVPNQREVDKLKRLNLDEQRVLREIFETLQARVIALKRHQRHKFLESLRDFSKNVITPPFDY